MNSTHEILLLVAALLGGTGETSKDGIHIFSSGEKQGWISKPISFNGSMLDVSFILSSNKSKIYFRWMVHCDKFKYIPIFEKTITAKNIDEIKSSSKTNVRSFAPTDFMGAICASYSFYSDRTWDSCYVTLNPIYGLSKRFDSYWSLDTCRVLGNSLMLSKINYKAASALICSNKDLSRIC